ncbi:SAM-dependent methyltransferase [Mycolicibacterium duvalii]|uniref:S-adenosyl-L-methionine-dependent methyltransferase n=1 Tax=Mycolicibacterium duvalii TaxID=39688 RepID=A0A7I7K0C7_9MYCO|nr:class I SAM-dependent methyltransferase [Mycolicibacterium duvalii]MCV7370728.1 class I SAM-dependent methyltransferase [Mycolicibacterium duvalii]PEG37898.1 SAM-dependent methyltransferase [Mycolicibacterium duvalii]BBX16969.1 putative S-adenosyl-L-methionine-dependent methyltransferase [Mycolicibacterium duvalii]
MSRSDNGTWDITESVGATALGVAAGRAAETISDDPLIRDPYAQMFLDAVGDSSPHLYVHDGELSPELAEIDPRIGEWMQAMRGYVASRTRYFDEFFLAAAGTGIRQAVILAAGLDARAWRLDWPAGSRVFELDQPKVLEFKTSTLASQGVAQAPVQLSVPVDLRHDWPAALRAAGFDPTAPTAWSAEGLLPYLNSAAQDLLFERIADLSAPGSRVAVEAFAADLFSAESNAQREAQMQRYREVAAKLGRADVLSTGSLFYEEERSDVVEWLSEHGWQTTAIGGVDLMARNGRGVAADLDDATPQSVFVEGRLS